MRICSQPPAYRKYDKENSLSSYLVPLILENRCICDFASPCLALPRHPFPIDRYTYIRNAGWREKCRNERKMDGEVVAEKIARSWTLRRIGIAGARHNNADRNIRARWKCTWWYSRGIHLTVCRDMRFIFDVRFKRARYLRGKLPLDFHAEMTGQKIETRTV